ncbi:MAG: penicillin-binding protein 2 [Deltaproteobacteria bacterium]|nr:penicillin-binding protein 2 [Deltaproteobacteria bacterium]
MKNYLNTVNSDWFSQRITGVILCITVAFSVLFVRVFYLQIIEGETYRRLSENNSIRLQSVDAPRGLIFDANRSLLVDNRPSFDLGIILKDAKPLEETVDKLAGYLDIPATEITTKIKAARGVPSYKPIFIKRDIGRNAMAAVEVHKFDLPGVTINIRPVRHYISSMHASHLIGYLGEINSDELESGDYVGCRGGDYIGRFGIEKSYEDMLRGKRGGRQVEVNVRGQVVRVMKTVDALPGRNLFLTVDTSLQKLAESLMTDKVGAVVAMDPDNGHILAMVSNPMFDQNAFVSGLSHDEWNALLSNPDHPMTNKVLQGEYPPASTYKIVTAIAGLEEAVIDEETIFNCPGYYVLGNRVFRCWKRGGHGKVDIHRAIAESCDVYFYQVGEAVGVDRLAHYATAFGLGSPTGINLDNEASGLIPTSQWKRKRLGEPWQKGETLTIAIGQGFNLTTPLQMSSLVAAIANGGTLYRPVIVGSVETADGNVLQTGSPHVSGRLNISEKSLAIVRKGLWAVVNGKRGTARGSRLKGIEMSGKTGTAQVVAIKEPDREGGQTDKKEVEHRFKDHAWFVAYAPSADPTIAVAVIVEHGEHGSSTAAPIAKAVIQLYIEKKEGEYQAGQSAGSGELLSQMEGRIANNE